MLLFPDELWTWVLAPAYKSIKTPLNGYACIKVKLLQHSSSSGTVHIVYPVSEENRRNILNCIQHKDNSSIQVSVSRKIWQQQRLKYTIAPGTNTKLNISCKCGKEEDLQEVCSLRTRVLSYQKLQNRGVEDEQWINFLPELEILDG